MCPGQSGGVLPVAYAHTPNAKVETIVWLIAGCFGKPVFFHVQAAAITQTMPKMIHITISDGGFAAAFVALMAATQAATMSAGISFTIRSV